MSKNLAISLRTRWLSERLRSARLDAGYSLVEAGEYLQMDHTTLSRFERGTHRIRRAYVKELLDFYGVVRDRERNFLLQLAADAWRKGWTDAGVGDLDVDFVDLTWLESESTRIRVYEPMVVHGLLQTPHYTKALARNRQSETVDEAMLDRIVEVRERRQRILEPPDATPLVAIFEETAIRRPIGDLATQAEQLNHLLAMSQKRHVEIRVVTAQVADSPGHHGPFAYFEMPDPYPEIVYIENLAGRVFLEDNIKVAACARTYDDLWKLSLSPKESRSLIRQTLESME